MPSLHKRRRVNLSPPSTTPAAWQSQPQNVPPSQRYHNTVDGLSHLPLGRHVYVEGGVGFEPALLVRYVRETGAVCLPTPLLNVRLDVDHLARAHIAQCTSPPPPPSSVAAAAVPQKLTAVAARTLGGWWDANPSYQAQALDAQVNALVSDLRYAQCTRTRPSELGLLAAFCDEQVRGQVEVAIELCNIDRVESAVASVRHFAQAPWTVLCPLFATYVRAAPLAAVQTALQLRDRAREVLRDAAYLVDPYRDTDGTAGAIDEERVLCGFYHLSAFKPMHDALLSLFDAVHGAVAQPSVGCRHDAEVDTHSLAPSLTTLSRVGGSGVCMRYAQVLTPCVVQVPSSRDTDNEHDDDYDNDDDDDDDDDDVEYDEEEEEVQDFMVEPAGSSETSGEWGGARGGGLGGSGGTGGGQAGASLSHQLLTMAAVFTLAHTRQQPHSQAPLILFPHGLPPAPFEIHPPAPNDTATAATAAGTATDASVLEHYFLPRGLLDSPPDAPAAAPVSPASVSPARTLAITPPTTGGALEAEVYDAAVFDLD